MTQYWVGSGWKMNHLIKESIEYAEALKDFVEEEKPKSNIFICVPYSVINLVSEILSDSGVFVSAQNSHWLDRGTATREISPLMIKDAGATMVEIGHSERRESF